MGFVGDLRGRRVYLDTNVFIYALNGFPSYLKLLTDLFGAIDDGIILAVTSELTVAEILVIPFRHGDAEEEKRCRMMLAPRRGLELVPVDMEVLESAARTRAALPAVRTPDAIHVATARLARCEVFLTNDRRCRAIPGLAIAMLSEAAT